MDGQKGSLPTRLASSKEGVLIAEGLPEEAPGSPHAKTA
jgi:hypothetical protein